MARTAQQRDIADLRQMNLQSIDVLTKAAQRLAELRRAADDSMLQDHIDAETSTVELELRVSTIVQTRLQAAGITVVPLSNDDNDELTNLAAKIDGAIQRDEITNALLGEVSSIVSAATDLRDLVKKAVTPAT